MRHIIGQGLLLVFLTACAATQSVSPSQDLLPAGKAAQPVLLNARLDPGGDIVATVPSLTSVRDMGRSPAATHMVVALTLNYRDPGGLESLIDRQSLSTSGSYRHWLTSEEFNAQFAPSEADYAQVKRSLTRAGLSITQTYTNRTVIDAAGRVGAIEQYFHTEIHDVIQSGYRGQVNVVQAHAPADLGGKLLSVDGLDTIVTARPQYVLADARSAHPMNAKAAGWPLFGPPSSQTNLVGYGPQAFSRAYDLPVVHSSGGSSVYNGKGRASAILMDADFVDSDLVSFLKYFRITRAGPATQRVPINGGASPGNEAPDTVETTLDVEAVVSLAPGTALYVYEIPTLSGKNITDAYNKIVTDNKADVVSSSFGGCEDGFASTARSWNAIVEQGVAKGITFSAGSGDGGGGLCGESPATGTYFVAVGGTSLSIGENGAWFSEVAWSGSGGSVSSVFPQPTWQQSVTGTNNRGRNIPDIAFDADPQTGMAFYLNGYGWNSQYNPIGGTSLASPIYAAAVTEIDQVKNGRVGLDAPTVYSVWKNQGYGGAAPSFHDITVGGNGAYYAAPGYDLVTGIGSVDAWNIAAQL